MILTDTSVVIDYLRTGDPRLQQIFVNYDAAICGVTRAEVLHGARDPAQLQQLIAGLNVFRQLPIPDSLWDKIGQNLAILRAAGLTIPFVDVVLATVAIENDIELWTRDAHFANIQSVLSALKLFQEPP